MTQSNAPTQEIVEGMLCPACCLPLVMTERQNVEIDYCPKCRGVWLDRGELDKIIERSLPTGRAAEGAAYPPPAPSASAQPRSEPSSIGFTGEQRHGNGHRGGGKHGGSGHGSSGYRRKSWLSEIFD